MKRLTVLLFVLLVSIGFAQSRHSSSPYGDIPILGYIYGDYMDCNTLNRLLREDFVPNPNSIFVDENLNLGCGRIPPTGYGGSDRPFVRLNIPGNDHMDVRLEASFRDGFLDDIFISPGYGHDKTAFIEYFYNSIVSILGRPVCTYYNEVVLAEIMIWYGTSDQLIGIVNSDKAHNFTHVAMTKSPGFLTQCIEARGY